MIPDDLLQLYYKARAEMPVDVENEEYWLFLEAFKFGMFRADQIHREVFSGNQWK